MYTIFTTMSEINKSFYLKRLNKSYLQFFNYFNLNKDLKNELFDYYAIVDGIISEADYKNEFPLLSNVKFVNNYPVLGIKSNTRFFAGWKRSFKVGLQTLSNVEKLLYVDNDCKILNFNKIFYFLNKPANFASNMRNDEHPDWMETSLIVINDVESRRFIIDFYSNDENVFNETNGDATEVQVGKILKPEFVFNSRRTFSRSLRFTDYSLDFLSNYWHFNAELN